MNQYRHCFICPTFGHYDYARAAIESFLRNTIDGVVVVADDGFPDFFEFWDSDWPIISKRFKNSRGLTRSWNYGLLKARELGAEYAICGNSDILFTPLWDSGPMALLADDSVGLVGPLSNAPGKMNNRQDVWNYLRGYMPSDAPEDLARTAAALRSQFGPKQYLEVPFLNGFFMMAKTTRWWDGAYGHTHVFDPHLRFSMTANEGELQRRFRARGWKCCVSLQSFVFHYRSVSRGNQHVHGMWFRRKPRTVQPNDDMRSNIP